MAESMYGDQVIHKGLYVNCQIRFGGKAPAFDWMIDKSPGFYEYQRRKFFFFCYVTRSRTGFVEALNQPMRAFAPALPDSHKKPLNWRGP
jgi:hypothetical protein